MCSASSLESLLLRGKLGRCDAHRVQVIAGAHHSSDSLPLESRRPCCWPASLPDCFGFQGYLTETPARPYQPFLGPVLPDNPIWREECGACHLAFHPSLLPRALMEGLDGRAGIPFRRGPVPRTEARSRIEAFLLKNAAEQASTEAAWKIDRSILRQKRRCASRRQPAG